MFELASDMEYSLNNLASGTYIDVVLSAYLHNQVFSDRRPLTQSMVQDLCVSQLTRSSGRCCEDVYEDK